MAVLLGSSASGRTSTECRFGVLARARVRSRGSPAGSRPGSACGVVLFDDALGDLQDGLFVLGGGLSQ